MSKGFHVRPSVFFRDRLLVCATISFFETGIFNPLRNDPPVTFAGLVLRFQMPFYVT